MPRNVLFLRSSVKDKLPTAAQLPQGAIALNYNKDNEKLAIKNSNNEIVTFSSDTVWNNYHDTVEAVIAASLNDLNLNKISQTDADERYMALEPEVVVGYMTNTSETGNNYVGHTFVWLDNQMDFNTLKGMIEDNKRVKIEIYSSQQSAESNNADPLYVFDYPSISYASGQFITYIGAVCYYGYGDDLEPKYLWVSNGNDIYSRMIVTRTEAYKFLRIKFASDYILALKSVWDAAMPGLTSMDQHVSSLASTTYICFDPKSGGFVTQDDVYGRVMTDVYTNVYLINTVSLTGADGCLLKLEKFNSLDPQVMSANYVLYGVDGNTRYRLAPEGNFTYSFNSALTEISHVEDISTTDVANWNSAVIPVIVDTRTTSAATATGAAPFSSLVDGQRITFLTKQSLSITSPKLKLTLSDNTETSEIPIYTSSYSSSTSNTTSGIFSNTYIDLIYEETNNRWVMIGQRDTNSTYTALTLSQLNAGTSTTGQLISPSVLKSFMQKEADRLYYATAYYSNGGVDVSGFKKFDGYSVSALTETQWCLAAIQPDDSDNMGTYIIWFYKDLGEAMPFTRVYSNYDSEGYTATFTNVLPDKIRSIVFLYDEVNDTCEWTYSETVLPVLTVDDEFDEVSENPVQNKVIYQALVENEQTMSAALNDLNLRVVKSEPKSMYVDLSTSQAEVLYILDSGDFVDFGTHLPTTVKTKSNVDANGYILSYKFQFTATQNNQTIDIKDANDTSVLWNGGSAPATVTGRKYQISVVNGLATYGEFY